MQSKGTIIYVGGFELPDKNAAAQRVLSIAKILRELGYDVIFLGVDKTLKKKEDLFENNYKTQNFIYHAISYPKTNKEWFFYITSISELKKVINKYNNIKSIIFYNYQSVAYIKAIHYCKKKGIKVIGDCTEWYDFRDGGFVFRIVKSLDVFLRMRVIQKRLDGLIVISEYLKKYYNKRENIVKIPPLVDFEEEKWKQKVGRSKKNVIKFVYSGNPGSNKDKLDIIFNLLKDFKKIELEIIGITKNE